MENSSGPASARTCECSNGSLIGANRQAARSNRPLAGCRAHTISTWKSWISTINLSPIFSESITRNGKKNSPSTKRFSTRSAGWFRRNCRNNANSSSRVSLSNHLLGSSRAKRGSSHKVVDHATYQCDADFVGGVPHFVRNDPPFLSQKFANRLTGSEYFQWVRRLRRTRTSQRQARRIALRFVGRVRTISKESTSIFPWGN